MEAKGQFFERGRMKRGLRPRTFNIQHSTSNVEVVERVSVLGRWALNACSRSIGVECWMFAVSSPERGRSLARSASPAIKHSNHSNASLSSHPLRTGTVRAPQEAAR